MSSDWRARARRNSIVRVGDNKKEGLFAELYLKVNNLLRERTSNTVRIVGVTPNTSNTEFILHPDSTGQLERDIIDRIVKEDLGSGWTSLTRHVPLEDPHNPRGKIECETVVIVRHAMAETIRPWWLTALMIAGWALLGMTALWNFVYLISLAF